MKTLAALLLLLPTLAWSQNITPSARKVGIRATPSERSAFGEVQSVEPRPLVQIDAIYGLLSTDVETFSATGGSATASGSLFTVQSGTSVGGYGVIRSKRAVRYRPGQGAVARFTAAFSTPVALSTQRAGLFTSTNSLEFGYNGTDFGVLRRKDGQLEVQTLTLSAGASGAETATITLAGAAQAGCSITSGSTQVNASEVADCSFTGWNAYANGSTVVFVATTVDDKTGTFSFSSTGTAAGTFAETMAGASVTDDWTAQSDWNVDPMDGTGPSRMTLDHTKLNVYQIMFQYLGAGAITFAIENTETGVFQEVHRVKYANTSATPTLTNPTMPIGWTAASLGSSGTNMTVTGASAAGFVQGVWAPKRHPNGQVSTEAVGSTLEPVLSIRNRAVMGGTVNQREIYPRFVRVGVDSTGNKPAEVQLVLNGTLTGGTTRPIWTYQDQTDSCAEYDVTGDGISGGEVVGAGAVAAGGTLVFDLETLGLRVERTETLTVAAKFSTGSGDITASMSWLEE